MLPDQAPLPVQETELAVDHVRVALWPGNTALGLTEMLTVGGKVAVGAVKFTVDPPPQPERTGNESNTRTRAGKYG